MDVRYLIRQAHGGETRVISDGAWPYFQNQGYVIVQTLGAPPAYALPALPVVHGDDANALRPDTIQPVVWYGSVAPVHLDAGKGDEWVTSGQGLTEDQIASSPALRAACVPARQPALAKLDAGLAARQTTPCRLAFVGSSTTAGLNASATTNRYVNVLVGMIQAAFPSGAASETAVISSTTASFGALSTAPGVHAYNAGEGGTDSATYLTGSEITNVAALNPRMVMHMIGANDFGTGVSPATFKANVQSVITGLKAAAAGPCVHVLVQTYQRMDVSSPAHAWALYGQALAEIAAADPHNVAYVDLSGAYEEVGVPGSDPLNLVDTDGIHQTNAGHAFMAYQLRRALGLPSGGSSSSTSSSGVTLARLTSDGFTGSDATTVVGRTTDLVLGGAVRTWVGDGANAAAISGGRLIRGSIVTFFCGWPEGFSDVEFSLRVIALPTGTTPADGLIMDIHRQAAVVAGTPDAYRLLLRADGVLELTRRIGGVGTVLVGGLPYAVNDRLALRYYQGTLEVRRNAAVIASVADATITTPGYAGLAGSTALTSFSVDHLALDAVA